MGNTRIWVAAALTVPTLLLTACGGQSDSSTDTAASGGAAASGEVRVDGSSTVGPLTAAAGELFNATPEGAGINVSVGQSGTGGGFKKFCAGETDISDASRSDQGRGGRRAAPRPASSTPRSPWPTTR